MSDIRTNDAGGIRVIVIDRPERANSLRLSTIADVADAIADTDPSITGLIITGSGGRFSAGADVGELAGSIDDLRFDDALQALTTLIAALPIPVVAAIEGACFGAAVDLAWSCDLVVLAETTRIGLPATRLGILYNPVTLARLHARLGGAIVRRLVVAGEELDGVTVASAGAARGVEAGATLETARSLIAAAGGVPAAVGATKAVLAALDAGDFHPTDWTATRHELLASPERMAALRAGRERLGRDQS